MTSQIKRLIKKKRFYNKAKWSKLSSDWVEYRSVQTQVRRSIRAEHQNYIPKILNSCNNLNGNKPFWQYIKSCKKDQTTISSLQTPDGIAPLEKANNTFKSVFTSQDSSPLPTLPTSTYPSLPEINITEQDVFSLLSQIDPYKACRPDKIPARVLALKLTPMITHLFKQSLATIVDCHQKGNLLISHPNKRCDPSNYWPVSLTSILFKTFEHILIL